MYLVCIPVSYTHLDVYKRQVQDSTGNSHLIMKGDIAHILSRCSHVEYRGTRLPMEKDARQSVFSVVGEMLQDGMKVIAVARKHVGTRKEITPDDEKDMTLVGYLSFFDAPKQTASESITALKRLKAVSYTHLDVYKRQTLFGSKDAIVPSSL